MMFSTEAPGEWPQNKAEWTVEFLNWSDPANQDQARRLVPSPGWRWLQGSTLADGPLVGGSFEILDWLRGTEWWPDLDGAVLAFETSEEGPPAINVERFLRSLAASGDLARIKALLFGRQGGSKIALTIISNTTKQSSRYSAKKVSTSFPWSQPWTLAIPIQCGPCRYQQLLNNTPESS